VVGDHPGGYTPEQFRQLAAALNNVGMYCRDHGLVTGLHPHTGTAIETRADIDAIMDLLDPDAVGFAPDTGQIAKGGSDILEVMRTYQFAHHPRPPEGLERQE